MRLPRVWLAELVELPVTARVAPPLMLAVEVLRRMLALVRTGPKLRLSVPVVTVVVPV